MEFKKYRVEELVKLGMLEKPMDGNHGEKHPTSKDYVEKGIPFIMVSDITNGKIKYNTCKFITKDVRDGLDKGFARTGDVLLSHKATIGMTTIVGDEFEEIVLTPQLTYYRVKSGINNEYLKYYFDSEYFQSILKNWATSGSTRAYLGITAQLKLPILLPDLNNQNKIAKVLSDVDKKIELNNQMNEKLFEIGKILFNESFDIQSIEKKKLEEVCFEITRGYTKNYVEKSNIINLNQKANKGEFLEKQYFKYLDENQVIPKNRFVKKNDILLNSLGQGTLGRVHLYKETVDNIVIDQHITIIRTDNDIINPYYLYYLLISIEYQNELEGLITGTTGMQMLNISAVRKLKIPIPNKEKIDAFEEKVKWMFEKINSNNLENENLVILRDTLLSKLMNNEIDLDKIEI